MNDLTQTLNHSILRAHDFELLEIEGSIPDSLAGTLYRAGPGLLERFGKPVTHPFDADGAMTAIRFQKGQAYGASKIVSSAEFQKEERSGRFLYGSSAAWSTQLSNALRGRAKCTGNTNMFSWQGCLYALMEGAKAIEIDAETLEAKLPADFGVVRGWFSAHPHRVELTCLVF